ncbi:probable protein phosphatase CG10417 [Drosophila sulfurigaster albostrigata]|uniref:probable protein phosphatase CG10417 n=1 Tax=Drosophila sulfurigaster albostrigata TaxID=89887 RepID=UPI002D21D0D3|nr:probable protein phosphatase CG10417 [Drosophila sulfurigaster albostrigata]
MGAYLSQPKTDKASTDESNELLVVGASSMQGWRNSQEDAHNAILDFDKNTSFFAVYDGHGGAEVAQYCADKLPEFLKNLDTYKRGALEKALKDAFLGFDKTLLEPTVVTTLKILAGEHNIVDDEADGYDEEDDAEELAELHEESHLPLSEVLEKYKGLPQTHDLALIKSAAVAAKLSTSSSRGRRAAAVAAEAVNKAVMDPTAKPVGSSTSAAAAAAAAAISETDGPGPSCSGSSSSKLDQEDESTVSSSSSSSASKSNNSPTVASNNSTNATSNIVNIKAEASSNKQAGVATTEQNGIVTSSEAKAAVKSEAESDTTSEDATVSGSSDVADKKANGNVEAEAATAIKVEPADISSTSKESEKSAKKAATQEDDSTDDDADYDENAAAKAQESAAAEVSSDEDMDEDEEDDDVDDDDDEDDEDDDDDENVSDEDDTDEDQLANDQFCANMIEEPGKDSGCTAVVCVLHGRDLYVANAGDSRCVISRNGKAIEMSLDHKPEDDEESTRIVNAGGRVTLDGRVNGGLNLSRALGDHAYKTNLELSAEAQMISALPDVKKLIISPEDEFMVLACDGIWNYMTSEEVVKFVRLRLKDENKKLSQVCEELFDNCLAPNTMGDGTGCDNMTAVIVKFQQKLQELPATIDPTETEDALLAAAALKLNNQGEQVALKRSASPDTPAVGEAESAENASKSKRVKIENNPEKAKDDKDVISSMPSLASASPSVDEPKESSVVVSST